MSKLVEAAAEFLGRDTLTKGNHFTEAMKKETLMHYQQTMASIIKRYPGEAKDRDQIANHHAKVMKSSNPNFDHKGFLKAAGVVKEEVEDDQLFIELLSANTFNSLSEEDQDRYLEALEKLDEISVETMKSAKEKLGKKAFNASYDDNKRAAQKFAQRAMAMGSRIAKKQRQTNT